MKPLYGLTWRGRARGVQGWQDPWPAQWEPSTSAGWRQPWRSPRSRAGARHGSCAPSSPSTASVASPWPPALLLWPSYMCIHMELLVCLFEYKPFFNTYRVFYGGQSTNQFFIRLSKRPLPFRSQMCSTTKPDFAQLSSINCRGGSLLCLVGLEPLTLRLRAWCSTDYAKPGWHVRIQNWLLSTRWYGIWCLITTVHGQS